MTIVTHIDTLSKRKIDAHWMFLSSCWGSLGEISDWNPDWNKVMIYLVHRYQTPKRYYHNLNHIEYCLRELQEIDIDRESKIIIELAIWFHDAVYDISKTDNEEQSAKLAVRCLNAFNVNAVIIDKVEGMILKTKDHKCMGDWAENIFLDIDMSILAADNITYRKYKNGILREFKEYCAKVYESQISNRDFYTMRNYALNKILDMDQIFVSAWYIDKEAKARENLKLEIFENENYLKKGC